MSNKQLQQRFLVIYHIFTIIEQIFGFVFSLFVCLPEKIVNYLVGGKKPLGKSSENGCSISCEGAWFF